MCARRQRHALVRNVGIDLDLACSWNHADDVMEGKARCPTGDPCAAAVVKDLDIARVNGDKQSIAAIKFGRFAGIRKDGLKARSLWYHEVVADRTGHLALLRQLSCEVGVDIAGC